MSLISRFPLTKDFTLPSLSASHNLHLVEYTVICLAHYVRVCWKNEAGITYEEELDEHAGFKIWTLP